MDDKAEIDRLAERFYGLFTNRDGAIPDVAGIQELFVTGGTIVKTCGDVPVVYDLDGFVEPRERLLRGGELRDFEEHELLERTAIAGDIAQRLSVYAKSGVLRGEPFQGRGVKTMQFVRVNGTWKMSAVAWDDEREGFAIGHELLAENAPDP